MENEVIKAIKSRRSIRRYKSAPVPKELLEEITAAAAWAPSGSNHQTWRFTVLCGESALAELNEAVRVALRDSLPVPGEYPSLTKGREHAADPNFHFFYHAPSLIVFSNDADYPNAMADCAAAMENLMLAAHSLGLGTCWINQLHWLDGDESVREHLGRFGVPKSHTVCGAVAVGYPDGAIPQAPARKPGTVCFVE